MRIWLFVSVCLLSSTSLVASEVRLDKVDIDLPHPVNGSLLALPERQQLLVSGFNQFERWLSQISLSDFTVSQIPIPAKAQFFTKATLAQQKSEQLVFITTDGISWFTEKGELKPLVQSGSLYRVVDSSRLREKDFVVNLGSDLSDFILPDFSHLQLFRQQADGQFIHYPLKVPALVRSWNDKPNYQPRPYYVLDVNADNKLDIIVILEGQFYAFLQQSDASFLTTAQKLDWPLRVSTEQEADQRNDAGDTYAGKNIDSLAKLTDIDGDGIVDMVIEREQFIDALERKTSFRIHFGQQTAKGISFNSEPDTTINTNSSPIDVKIADINGDGKQDFYISSTHFGVGTIIRVLLRGSASLDVDFYLLDANRRYKNKADFRQAATIDVSIGNFRFDMPLLQLVDLNADGKSSLLFGDGSNKLRFYLPDNKRLFQRGSIDLKVELPRDAKQVKVLDLNNDNKDDIILPFSSHDNNEQRNHLILLLSKNNEKS
ncbi:VCBS repeat-containing protein [Rheinheimera sp. MMS21-TC3]|uniref:FG-GAP repeat domain-containing protein n=1 Tax=Rheinheimera sp. MMS21-TC3 TaxID=3072790 RepID=UPI0028C40EA3|nr:VCBS repeat-containing protein [Rheinheimera sp. MMS21-TC3]WNO61283.1 VCBS repeat-containing protein [Rheinheimera sp. MMS21-TC3]